MKILIAFVGLFVAVVSAGLSDLRRLLTSDIVGNGTMGMADTENMATTFRFGLQAEIPAIYNYFRFMSAALISALTSTSYNGMSAILAFDGNQSTCAMTGYETYPWYLIDMDDVKTVKSVLLTGSATATTQILVGPSASTIGLPGGFIGNPQCAIIAAGFNASAGSPFTATCSTPRRGQYVSIQIVALNVGYGQLNLCEVVLQ